MNTTPKHRVWKLGADVDTDQLAPGTYMKLTLPEIATHCLEGVRPEFAGQVKPGDVIALREKSKNQLRVQDALKLAQGIGLADWVSVDATKMEGTFKKVPDRDQYGQEIKEALIVELYSR